MNQTFTGGQLITFPSEISHQAKSSRSRTRVGAPKRADPLKNQGHGGSISLTGNTKTDLEFDLIVRIERNLHRRPAYNLPKRNQSPGREFARAHARAGAREALRSKPVNDPFSAMIFGLTGSCHKKSCFINL